MRKSIQICAALVLTASISSCATQKFIIADKTVSRKADSEKFSHFFIAGVGQQTESMHREFVKVKKSVTLKLVGLLLISYLLWLLSISTHLEQLLFIVKDKKGPLGSFHLIRSN